MNIKDIHVAHLSSVHQADDLRIFYKEACSLSDVGFRVSLIAQAEKKELYNGVQIIALDAVKKRWHRILRLYDILHVVSKIRPNVVHLHDPELLLLVPLLKWKYRLFIIFDFHESVISDIRSKYWLPSFFRPMIAKIYDLFQQIILNCVDGLIVVSAESIHEYKKYPGNRIEVVQNYPILSKKTSNNSKRIQSRIIFVGRATPIRGVEEMIQAMKFLKRKDATLELIGPIDDQYHQKLEDLVRILNLTDQIIINVATNQKNVEQSLERSQIGLALNHPVPNHLDGIPTKIYTYMMNRLPIVAANLPLWINLIDKHNCGITVDPYKPKEIADALNKLLGEPELRNKMGQNGYAAVKSTYNWKFEFEKLLNLYKQILKI